MRARKVDDNQAGIVTALRSMGCSVAITSGAGNGFPDIVVGLRSGCRKINLLVEIKDGKKPASRQKLTPAQIIFHRDWSGQIAVVSTVSDAINLINSYK